MKKILSIDGGGIRGLIPALILAELETKTKKPVAECFDLIAGTSTGGILALGLTKNNGAGKPKYSAKNLADIYESRGDEIFSRSVFKRLISGGGLTDEKYSHTGLEKILDDYFEEDLLGTALTKVFITSYDIQNRTPLFLKSWRKEYRTVKMKHAARATSAAPTYYEPALVPVEGASRALVDGGIFVNSPSVSAYAEAKRLFPDETDFLMLSLGTGEMVRPIAYKDAKDWGKVGWLVPLLDCMFDGMSDACDYQMQMILGDNYFRMQTTLSVASEDMDNATDKNINDLRTEAKNFIKAYSADIDKISVLLKKK